MKNESSRSIKNESRPIGSVKLENEISRVVHVRRTDKVVAGGRNYSISVLAVVGDGNGRVGFGTGSALEHPNASEKAMNKARRKLINIEMKDHRTVFGKLYGKFGASKVTIFPARKGSGIKSSLTARHLFEAIGFRDIGAKIHGSTNPYTVIEAIFKGLCKDKPGRYILNKRRKK